MSNLAEKLEKLNKATRKLALAGSQDELLERMLDVVDDVFGRDTAAVLLMEPDGEHFRIAGSRGYQREVVLGYRGVIGEGIAGTAASSRKPRLVMDVKKEKEYIRGVKDALSEMAVPLIVEDKVIGVLDVESRKTAFDEEDIALLTAFGEHAAWALRYQETLSDSRERARRMELLTRAARALNTVHDPEDLLERILTLAHEALGFDSVAILLPEGPGGHLVVRKALGRQGVEGLSIPPGQGIVGCVFASGQAEAIMDVTRDPRYIPGGMHGERSEMVAPLNLDGEIIGILDAESRRPNAFNQLDLEIFSAFSSQVATAIHNVRILRDLDERGKRLTLLNRAARALNTIHDPEELLDRILALADEALGFDSVAVLVVDHERRNLVVRKALRREGVLGLKIPVHQGVVGTVFSTGHAEIIDDVAVEPRYISGGLRGARSEIVAPLNLNGDIIGVLDAESERVEAFTPADLEIFSAFSAQVATALRNTELLKEIEKRANRLRLITRAGHALNTMLNVDDLIEEILKTADEAMGLGRAALLLLDPETQELVIHAAVGYGDVIGKRIQLGKGVTGSVAMTGKPELVRDVLTNGRYVSGVEGGATEMAVPLRVYGELIGVLDTESPLQDAFDEQDLDLFTAFADQASVAIHNARLFRRLEDANTRLKNNIEEMSRLNRELEAYAGKIAEANRNLETQIRQLTTLHQAGQTITSSLDLDHTLSAILQMSSGIVTSSAGAIKLIDEETKELKIKAQAGMLKEGSGPFLKYDLPLKIGEKTIGVFELIRYATEEMDDGERQMLETLATQASIAIENARLFEDTQRIYYDTLKSLAKALEARDDYTRGHSERVAELSLATAQEMGTSEEECSIIFNSALLHDIGKIGIRDSVLLKPRQLTADEMDIIRKHPTYGNAILGPLKFLGKVSELVKCHHERWDGSGYPQGLKRENIPFASRIIGVVDTYDAMTSTRPYRQAMSHQIAIEEITRQADRQFDPAVVKAFLRVMERRSR